MSPAPAVADLIPTRSLDQRYDLDHRIRRRLLTEFGITIYCDPRDRRKRLVDPREVDAALARLRAATVAN